MRHATAQFLIVSKHNHAVLNIYKLMIYDNFIKRTATVRKKKQKQTQSTEEINRSDNENKMKNNCKQILDHQTARCRRPDFELRISASYMHASFLHPG